MYRIGRTLSLFAVVALAAVGLSGCSSSGGDGGGGSSLSETQLYGDLDAYEKLAANNPNFGSVTQSSNAVGGTTTDSVETMFDGEHLTVIVKDDADRERFRLNSDDDEYENLSGTAWMDDDVDDFPADWSGDGWVLWKEDEDDEDDEDGDVVAFVYAAWDDDDETNYLAGGYWIRYGGDGVEEIGTFGDAGSGSVFAYADDPNSTWMRPTSGDATYYGTAEGAYVWGDEEGVWWSRMKLEAAFATQTIVGCVGCDAADPRFNPPEGLDRGVYTYSNLEDLKNDDWTEESVFLDLEGTSNIMEDGTFQGTFTFKDLDDNTPLGGDGGRWGGRFSETDADTPEPEEVAGTLGGTFDYDGVDGGLVGVFHGVKE